VQRSWPKAKRIAFDGQDYLTWRVSDVEPRDHRKRRRTKKKEMKSINYGRVWNKGTKRKEPNFEDIV